MYGLPLPVPEAVKVRDDVISMVLVESENALPLDKEKEDEELPTATANSARKAGRAKHRTSILACTATTTSDSGNKKPTVS